MAPQPAYRYDYSGSAAAAPRPRYAPPVRVLPGSRPSRSTLDPRLIRLFYIALSVLLVVAMFSLIRVALTAATVNTSLQTEQISTNISAARATGNALEVKESALANPTHVKEAARALGMSAPAAVESIVLDTDIVATDDSGNLSLSRSLARGVQS